MSCFAGPSIARSGLQICMDWGDTRCYPGSGTTFTNLVNSTRNNGYIKNNCSYSSASGGVLTTGGANSGTVNDVGDRIDINTSAAGVDRFGGTDSFSIFFWVNLTSGSNVVFATGSAGSGTGLSDNCVWFMRMIPSNLFWWDSSGGGTNNMSISTTIVTTGSWQMVGFTYSYNESSNNVLRVYRNGVELGSQSIATSTHSYIDRRNQTDMQWTLGGGYYSGCVNQNAPAKYGNFMLYNKKLSVSEIVQNYEASRYRFGV